MKQMLFIVLGFVVGVAGGAFLMPTVNQWAAGHIAVDGAPPKPQDLFLTGVVVSVTPHGLIISPDRHSETLMSFELAPKLSSKIYDSPAAEYHNGVVVDFTLGSKQIEPGDRVGLNYVLGESALIAISVVIHPQL